MEYSARNLTVAGFTLLVTHFIEIVNPDQASMDLIKLGTCLLVPPLGGFFPLVAQILGFSLLTTRISLPVSSQLILEITLLEHFIPELLSHFMEIIVPDYFLLEFMS